jgi:hypothetical protein
MKVHAQETILYDEMVKELAKSRLSREQQQAEESFKHHIDQYRQRTALILEQKRVRMKRVECVCMSVCAYIYVYVYVYVYVYICIYMCVRLCVLCVCVRVCEEE